MKENTDLKMKRNEGNFDSKTTKIETFLVFSFQQSSTYSAYHVFEKVLFKDETQNFSICDLFAIFYFIDKPVDSDWRLIK